MMRRKLSGVVSPKLPIMALRHPLPRPCPSAKLDSAPQALLSPPGPGLPLTAGRRHRFHGHTHGALPRSLLSLSFLVERRCDSSLAGPFASDERPPGWKCQISVSTWKRMHSSRHNAVITFAKKSTKRESRDFRNKSKDSLLISEEASSGSEGSTSSSLEVNSEDVATDEQNSGAPRSAVLQACTLTSGLLLAGGLLLRQVSHLASLNGWPIADATDVSFDFETWHLELVAGLVIVISSSRYILLQTWADFRDSSEAANRQILTSLEPLDYIVVACLPGISEELLFRGALMPILGLNWINALLVGTIFGALHLGNGRKYSFAIWATFVGFAYGIGTIASSSVIVPMVSHSLNNIIGGLLWQFTKNSQK